MAMKLITTNSGTNQTAFSFTSGIDSTYKLYIFKMFDVNPATDSADFQFNGSIDAGSNYNVTKTTTFFHANHSEADDVATLAYEGEYDLAQSTAFQDIMKDIGNDADSSGVGTLWLFNPSNTTYVKHWYCTTQIHHPDSQSRQSFIGGYFNDTNDIDAVQFKMNTGNFDGTVKMYGVG